MKPGETISDVHKRFTHIVNHLIGLSKVSDKEKLNIKILKCLTEVGSQRLLPFQKHGISLL